MNPIDDWDGESVHAASGSNWIDGWRDALTAIRPLVADFKEQAEAERNKADYERQARIDAADFPRNRHGYIPCQRCGIDCGMDAVIADDVWDRIAPIPEWPEAGMFCLWCMDELLVEAGVTGPIEVKVYFAGKVLVSAPYFDSVATP